MFRQKITLTLASLVMIASLNLGVIAPNTASAYDVYSQNYQQQQYYNNYNRPTYFQRHPYVKKALIGAGVGAGVGLLFSHGSRGVLKGAAIGTGAGLGYEYLRQRGVLNNLFH